MTQTATTEHPVVETYMKKFEAALRAFDCAQANEIVRDLRGHIAEATSMGKPVDAVLQSIGPAETLARAYAVELELNPRGEKMRRSIGGVLKVIGILAAASIVSLIVFGTLGSISISFMFSGLTLFVVGLMEAAGANLPYVQLAGLPPLLVAVLGIPMFALGAGAGLGLWAYLRALVRTLRRALPTSAR